MFFIRCKDVFTIFICLLFRFCMCQCHYVVFFAIFVLVTFDVLYLKSVRLEHFLELNYQGLNLNFLKLVQLLIDDDIESNPGPTQMIVNLHVDVQKKKDYFKEQQKRLVLVRTLMLILLVNQTYKIYFSIQYNLLYLNNIKPWSIK